MVNFVFLQFSNLLLTKLKNCVTLKFWLFLYLHYFALYSSQILQISTIMFKEIVGIYPEIYWIIFEFAEQYYKKKISIK